MTLRTLRITPEEKALLRKRLMNTAEITPIVSDPKFFSRIVALGIQQEIGTIHDELSKFLFEGTTGEKLRRESLKAELIEYNGFTGVRIWAEGVSDLDPRVRGMRSLLHPGLSFDERGKIHQLVFFPEIITRIAALEGAELVSVRAWGINTVFGGFDPRVSYYVGNAYELISVDALKYARLLESKQIVFWGTHDLVSHVAGIQRSAWPELQAKGRTVRALLEEYFDGVAQPVPFTLILPYALGMLLDDLAQPMNYESHSRRHVVELLIHAIRARKIDPRSSAYLLKYPTYYEKLVDLARADDLKETKEKAAPYLASLIRELHDHAVTRASLPEGRGLAGDEKRHVTTPLRPQGIAAGRATQ